MPPGEMIPSTIGGVTDGYGGHRPVFALQNPRGRFRPAPGGVSVGHASITTGTLGWMVRKDDRLYILSNNHVLANSNDAWATSSLP